ncbi:CoA pyrophosphatase [Citricoccus sp. I39-566]|uniref:NUDIX hydrolase n=1 Tax=Citricoccus sp. I39-566 TaxID=3073268 RepID=UPI0017BE9B45|nr:CoA pyrophosphatase [Citricoccus sp. I39-566]NUL47459.1 CoA pyrophosphatase [Cellulosimicrobium funkei]WMY78308.1 CoA pyrophosphatase [Citricoccus sp. I39-566]
MIQIDGALADLRRLVGRYGTLDPDLAARYAHVPEEHQRPDDGGRGWDFGITLVPPPGDVPPVESAVLVLFGALDGQPAHFHASAVPEDLDLLLTQRSLSLRQHPGQVAFPGGRKDPEDADHVQCAVREAEEETGLDRDGVRVIGTLPPAPLTVSNHQVTPVLGWWDRPSDVFVVDEGEAARVFRVPVADLVDPANRITTSLTRGAAGNAQRFRSPGFLVADALVWGFTAIVIDRILDLLGWSQDWDRKRIVDITDWDASMPVPRTDLTG